MIKRFGIALMLVLALSCFSLNFAQNINKTESTQSKTPSVTNEVKASPFNTYLVGGAILVVLALGGVLLYSRKNRSRA
jgi:uncharacterized protein HemX